jgi:DNA polymerase-3 subunit alpha
VKTVEELRKSFAWMDEEVFNKCIENTVKVADKCNVELDLGKSHLPSYPVPEGYDLVSYFDHLCMKGLKNRYETLTEDILKRYEYE